ncbi:hypothetical protein [Ostreibacterium oceani]|uniref:Uncharacterized protein n=1 Tax=Ostreibacterium oceani TaxID=2654998 RepID=A0A6N7EXP1_9GAMM|nr:hypothetical protein [Ostreibacterium oceani]MPV85897.1 hypothetical protein [Ostreibacterium oceani]
MQAATAQTPIVQAATAQSHSTSRMVHRVVFCLSVLLSTVSLSGCASQTANSTAFEATPETTLETTPETTSETQALSDMESIALCQLSAQAIQTEADIINEIGYKRFAKDSYRPTQHQQLFGREIRVITLNETGNKLYVAGEPPAFASSFQDITAAIDCQNDTCQALINPNQTLYIYKTESKNSTQTTVIECSKPELAAPDTDT